MHNDQRCICQPSEVTQLPRELADYLSYGNIHTLSYLENHQQKLRLTLQTQSIQAQVPTMKAENTSLLSFPSLAQASDQGKK
jgi:hypothetical protein